MPGATTAFSNFGLNQAMIGSTTDLARNTNPQETLMFATTKKFNNSAHNPGMGLTVQKQMQSATAPPITDN